MVALYKTLGEMNDKIKELESTIEYHFSDSEKPLPPRIMQNLEKELNK
jgi:hypothetical protein